jgi:hypothetical protein
MKRKVTSSNHIKHSYGGSNTHPASDICLASHCGESEPLIEAHKTHLHDELVPWGHR